MGINPHIFIAHNYYKQSGGEDCVYQAESALLRRNGHIVTSYEEHNGTIEGRSVLTAGLGTVWNMRSYQRVRSVLGLKKPDVVHFHNTLPLISPAAYYAVREHHVPIVQTLHNYRLLCAGATLHRAGTVCEKCIEHPSMLPAILHGCHRSSRAATSAVVAMLSVHRLIGTWTNMVDVYCVPSEFVKRKFIQGGLRADSIVVKPHFLAEDPGPGNGAGGYALFVGRLSEEKGIRTLADAWHRLTDIPLLVAGDGPLSNSKWPQGVTWLGNQSRKCVDALMKNAKVVIVPSTWYETGPLTVLEAFACGTPVIGSDIGSITERVLDHRTGLLFRPGDAEDLASKVRWAFDHPEQLAAMRIAARREFEEKYTAERNYKMLIEIYERAIQIRCARSAESRTQATANA